MLYASNYCIIMLSIYCSLTLGFSIIKKKKKKRKKARIITHVTEINID